MIRGRPGIFAVGAMRDRITVEAATESVDANGQTNRAWSTLLYREPAQYTPTSGGESFRGKQVEAGIRAIFTVHYRRNTYTPEQRIIHNGETYGIVYVQDVDGLRRYQQLECKAVVD